MTFNFESGQEPTVKLAAYTQDYENEGPYKVAVASARTCYSKNIVLPSEVKASHDAIAQSVYQAGHHTVFQHASFTFQLSGSSRHLVWSTLHSHQMYNSEQQSQRFVEVGGDGWVIKPAFTNDRHKKIWDTTVAHQYQDYQDLCRILQVPAQEELTRLFPRRAALYLQGKDKAFGSMLKKKAQEVARYVLPIACTTNLYFSVNMITLMRLWHTVHLSDTPAEALLTIGKMVSLVCGIDPKLKTVFEEPITGADTLWETQFQPVHQPPKDSLISHTANAEDVIVQAVRAIIGNPENMTDEDLIGLVMNPAENKLLGTKLNITDFNRLSRTMHHVHYSFNKRLSHTGDSQDQRHRMVPGSRPFFQKAVLNPDFIVPELVNQSKEARGLYMMSMTRSWNAAQEIASDSDNLELAQYLLPNATAINFVESGTLLSLHHKYRMRLCLNAQEEIWRSSIAEVKAIARVHPTIAQYLLPPCTVRSAGSHKPICPEGNRYCGVPVWKQDVTDIKRIL